MTKIINKLLLMEYQTIFRPNWDVSVVIRHPLRAVDILLKGNYTLLPFIFLCTITASWKLELE